ncbi:MAG TPA: hypothetical protein VIN04_10045 [Myxococcota bacterium]
MEPLAPLPRPSAPPPPPRSLGAILDAALDLLRRHWVLLVGLCALVQIPAAFAEAALSDEGSTRDLASDHPWLAAALLFSVLAVPVVTAAVTDACGEFLHGRTTDAGRALRRGLALAPRLVVTGLVLLLLTVVAALPLAAVAQGGAALGPARGPALVLAAALLLLVVVRFALLTQVVVLERRWGPAALVRASRLISGQVLRVVAVYLVAGLLMGLIGAVAGLALADLPVFAPVAIGFVQALAFAYTSAVGVVLYEDVRVRRGEADGPGPLTPRAGA